MLGWAGATLALVSTCGLAACQFSTGVDLSADARTADPDGGEDAAATDGSPTDSTAAGGDDAMPCELAGLVCSGMSAQFLCGGTCWVGCAEPLMHTAAEARCTAWGGELGRIGDQIEQDCVNLTFDPPNAAIWIGLIQDPSASAPNDKWSWSGDGAAPPYTAWSGGQPNDSDGGETGQEQCVYMSNPSGLWHDTECTANINAFVCSQ